VIDGSLLLAQAYSFMNHGNVAAALLMNASFRTGRDMHMHAWPVSSCPLFARQNH
jgi:hypothetical protein